MLAALLDVIGKPSSASILRYPSWSACTGAAEQIPATATDAAAIISRIFIGFPLFSENKVSQAAGQLADDSHAGWGRRPRLIPPAGDRLHIGLHSNEGAV